MKLLSIFALVLASSTASYDAEEIARLSGQVSVPDFLAYQEVLRESLRAGEPRALSDREWQQFDRIQARFRHHLSGIESIDDLERRHRLEVFNLQEDLRELIIGTHADRVVCRNTRRTGSNRLEPHCQTRREIAQEQERARDFFDNRVIEMLLPGDP